MKSIALYYSKSRISGSLFSADSHIVPATTIQSAVVVEVEQSRMKIAAATRQTVNNTMPVPYKEGGEKAATNTEERGDGFSDLKVQSVAVQSCFTNKRSQQ